ncbi:hypothetical protein [Desulfovibrio inopinatus]|uniref:hypothetical protein n=1 Tax=Desulfovibrio inopinatus TaxID=102109 RepID=UPI00040316E9|nr:hypothetical protein [Desulfovibrio inopinatus]
MKFIRTFLVAMTCVAVYAGVAGAVTITGTFNGCDIGQGMWGCSITTANGYDYYLSASADGTEGFGDLNTPNDVFETIDIDNWKGKTVILEGELNQDGELIEVDSIRLQ